MKPVAVDLCCGLGGWTDGLLAEGWDVIGFDVERHRYGSHQYPAQLVLQDILTLCGEQFRGNVSLIVASPPCQFFSYCAMPWTRAKHLAAEVRADPIRLGKELALFNACLRIGRDAQCPTIIENVRGAQPWVGRARWNFGSFYLWGDVPALMPIAGVRKLSPHLHLGGGNSFLAHGRDAARHDPRHGERRAQEVAGVKNKDADGYERSHPNAFGWKSSRTTSSNISARKAASAMIAKIPFALARHIAAVYR